MNPQNSKEDELRRREQELREREMAIRLRELEVEISPPPVMATTKHDRPESRIQRQFRQLIEIAKFVGLIAGAGILFVVVVRVGTFLATVVILSILGWFAYKFFLEKKTRR